MVVVYFISYNCKTRDEHAHNWRLPSLKPAVLNT